MGSGKHPVERPGLRQATDPDPAKAQLANAIRIRIRALGLTQVEAAARLRTDPGRVSQLMHGKVASFTYDRLLRFLNALECDIEIRVLERANHDQAGPALTRVTP